jgi:hypothetical protein
MLTLSSRMTSQNGRIYVNRDCYMRQKSFVFGRLIFNTFYIINFFFLLTNQQINRHFDVRFSRFLFLLDFFLEFVSQFFFSRMSCLLVFFLKSDILEITINDKNNLFMEKWGKNKNQSYLLTKRQDRSAIPNLCFSATDVFCRNEKWSWNYVLLKVIMSTSKTYVCRNQQQCNLDKCYHDSQSFYIYWNESIHFFCFKNAS